MESRSLPSDTSPASLTHLDRADRAASPPFHRRHIPNPVLAGIAGIALMLLIGLMSGQDYNWDLLNYHYASAQLLLSGRYDIHVAPSGLQSWFNPIGYIPAYLAITFLPPWLASAALAVVAGLNAPFIYAIAYRIGAGLPEQARVRSGFACVAIGMSGALMLSEAGTSFLDNTLSIAVLAALLVTMIGLRSHDPIRAALQFAIAGLLLGAACGLKLTNTVMAVGLTGALATLVAARRMPFRGLFAFSLGGLTGFLLTGGWWAWRTWRTLGNPVFPMFNGLFRSPFAPALSSMDTTFIPADWTGLFAFPWHWLVGDAMPGTEIAIRDPRYALAVIGSLAVGVAAVARARFMGRRHDDVLLVSTFVLCTYAVWLFAFAILRYVVAFEMVSGIVLLAGLRLLPARWVRHISTMMIIAAFGISLATRHATWGRVPFSGDWFGARGIPEDDGVATLYVLPGDTPLGFLIHFFPSDARFVRIGGTFPITPDMGLGNGVAAMIQVAPRLRSMEVAPIQPAERAALRRFGLVPAPGGCAIITTKRADVESCPLRRTQSPSPHR